MNIYTLTKEEQKKTDIKLSEFFGVPYTPKKYEDITFVLMNKGREPWNKGLKGVQEAWNKGIKGTSGDQTKSISMRKRISKKLMGHTVSDETKRKMSLAKIGKPAPNKSTKYEIVSCPHCHKTGGYPLMKRYHFQNCQKLGN